MNIINCYNNLIIELKILNERLSLINQNKKKIMIEEKNIKKTIMLYKQKTDYIKKNLSQLNGIEYELYKEIVINGLNVSKAVEKVAENNNKDVSTIWKNYYPRIKKIINNI